MGLFSKAAGKIYASSVAATTISTLGYRFEDFSDIQQQTLIAIALSLKDQGLSKQEAKSAIIQLADKYGNLFSALNIYTSMLRTNGALE